MGDEDTAPESGVATEQNSLSNRLRHWIVAQRNHLPLGLRVRGGLIAAAYTLIAAANMVGVGAAQQGGGGGGGNLGNQLCGTTVAKTINSLAPMVLGVVVIGGLILCYLLHAYSGFMKNPEKVREIKEWRNRAGIAAITAPLLGKVLEIIIGFMGLGLADCIHIVPF